VGKASVRQTEREVSGIPRRVPSRDCV